MNICSLKMYGDTLFSQKVGSVSEVASFGAALGDKYLRRLLEIGLTCGTRLRVLKKSIRGKTLLIDVRGVAFSMEKEIALQIYVK